MFWRIPSMSLDWVAQFSALLRAPVYRGVDVPHGKGEPVLLIPGFLAGDWMLLVMAGWLRRLGYRPYLSGIACNIGNPYKTGEMLSRRLAQIAKAADSAVVVIGHSLGGVLARFLGAHFPQHVRQVVTLGAPIHNQMAGHPWVLLLFFFTQALRPGALFPRGNESERVWEFSASLSAPLPPGVRSTSIFSKGDDIVYWRTSVDRYGENWEVSGQHISLVVNPEVYAMLARVLGGASVDTYVKPSGDTLVEVAGVAAP
jgi:triacylglycerol lipase